MRRITCLVLSSLFIVGIISFGRQSAMAQDGQEAVQGQEAVDAGNKICPVSGEVINQDLKATYEYEGKIYNFCCPMCIDEFKNDPEKYIKKVEEELQVEDNEHAEEEYDMNMMQPDKKFHQEQGMHSGHHH